jgi:heme oxygenase
MRFPLIPVVALWAMVTLAPRTAHAHFIWGMIENGQARFALLEEPSQKPDARFESYVARLKSTLTLETPVGGACVGRLPADRKTAFASTVVGVKERAGVTYLLSYEAKGAQDMGSAATVTPSAPTEVLAQRDGDMLVTTVLQEGWPAPATEVTIHWPGGDMALGTTDLAGKARFAWPKRLIGGFLGIRAKVVEEAPGKHEGKSFTERHHWSSLTVPLSAPAADSSLSSSLRQAFRGQHEVVSGAAFNVTLFSGKLTRAQLETHLHQRALVHAEMDRILAGSAVPYGAAQQELLTYLRADLAAMGSGWPTAEQARPRTEAFLQELRESERQGPYFALGVHHVYYGGTTNGGRMIGKKIAETLGIALDYYGKSGGYPDYLRGVDALTAPEARAEMLRGGQAAYRYIIDSMNESVFQMPI